MKKPTFRLRGFNYDGKRGIVRLEVSLPGTRGAKRRRRTVKVASRELALEAYRSFREEIGIRDGRATIWTFAAYAEQYRRALEARIEKRGRPMLRYKLGILTRHLGPRRLDRISLAVVLDLQVALRDAGLGKVTRNGILRTLRRVLRDAVERQELARYPIAGRLPLEQEDPVQLEMSDEERRRFLAAFDDEPGFRRLIGEQRDERLRAGQIPWCFRAPDGDAAGVSYSFFRASRPLYIVALETGLARQDLLNLTWSHVRTSTIRFPRGKTGVEAVIPVSRACRAALDELKGRAVVDRTWIFLAPHGKRMNLDTLGRFFKIAKRLAGITRRLRFHDLRHTLACRLVSAGVPLAHVAKILGHKSTRTTERYARVAPESLEGARGVLDADPVSNELARELSKQTNGEEIR